MRSADLTARARIRDAAIQCFADAGFEAASVRAIAAAADVSPALVMHHFGSKEALRDECDSYVVELHLTRERDAMQDGLSLDPLAPIREMDSGPPVLRYLARTLVDGSPHVATLVDRLVAEGEALSRQAVAAGLMHPSDDEHARATVLTVWSLGALVLHEHVRRLLGVDLLGDPAHATRYIDAVTEVLGRPPLTDELYERLRDALREQQERTA